MTVPGVVSTKEDGDGCFCLGLLDADWDLNNCFLLLILELSVVLLEVAESFGVFFLIVGW